MIVLHIMPNLGPFFVFNISHSAKHLQWRFWASTHSWHGTGFECH